MIQNQMDILNVPSTLGEILQDRAASPGGLQRTFVLQNLGSTTLQLQFEDSVNGADWSIIDQAFSLNAGASVIKNLTTANAVRLRGSGGAASNDLLVQLTRFVTRSTPVLWVQGQM